MRQLRRLLGCGAVFLFAVMGAAFSPSTTVAVEQRSPALSVPIIEISPSSGGPGTVVQVRGVDAGGLRVALFLAVLSAPQAITGSRFPDLNGPIIPLGAAEGQGNAGTFTTTVTIPATWEPGRPITETELCIVAGEEGHLTDFKPFAFTPSTLPTAGKEGDTDWLIVALVAVSCTLMGGLALRKVADNP